MGELTEAYNKLKKINNSVVRKMTRDISKELNKTYVYAIEKFYSDYDPYIYQRGYNLFRAYSGMYSNKLIQRLGDGHYSGGIIVDSKYLGNNPYSRSENIVLNLTFGKGIHGVNRNYFINAGWTLNGNHVPKNTVPSPQKVMNQKYKELTKRKALNKMYNEYMNNALSKI